MLYTYVHSYMQIGACEIRKFLLLSLLQLAGRPGVAGVVDIDHRKFRTIPRYPFDPLPVRPITRSTSLAFQTIPRYLLDPLPVRRPLPSVPPIPPPIFPIHPSNPSILSIHPFLQSIHPSKIRSHPRSQ